MPSTHSDSSRSWDDTKIPPALGSTFRLAWTEFQLAVLLLPNSAAKEKVLSSIEQTNGFYHQRELRAMRQTMSQMVEEMKICLLPLNIKEKANDLLNLLKEERFF